MPNQGDSQHEAADAGAAPKQSAPVSPAAGPLPPFAAGARPPAQAVRPAGGRRSGASIGIIALVGALLFKGKSLIVFVLSKLKVLLALFKLKSLLVVLKSGGSMLLMIGVYALAWPVSFAVGFVLLILVHELGHAMALRALGIPFSAPIFIPFVGALIGMKQMPPDAGKEALVAFAGPFVGTIAAQFCLVLFNRTGHPVLLGLAQVGFMLNLFNLAPYSPLDGGRIVGAISPKIWLLALPLMLVAALYYHSLILILITVLGVPRAISAWRHRNDPERRAYYDLAPRVRLAAAGAYLGLAVFLGYMMYYAAQLAPPGTAP